MEKGPKIVDNSAIMCISRLETIPMDYNDSSNLYDKYLACVRNALARGNLVRASFTNSCYEVGRKSQALFVSNAPTITRATEYLKHLFGLRTKINRF